MSTLHIRWQRLVDEGGHTCERCGATEAAVDAAVGQLTRSLGALGIGVTVEKRTLEATAFRADPLASNRLWLADAPLETWLSGSVGQSPCCGSCGDAECRTLVVDGATHEAIPPELIVRAGLLAGARLLSGAPSAAAAAAGSCCAPSDADRATRCC